MKYNAKFLRRDLSVHTRWGLQCTCLRVRIRFSDQPRSVQSSVNDKPVLVWLSQIILSAAIRNSLRMYCWLKNLQISPRPYTFWPLRKSASSLLYCLVTVSLRVVLFFIYLRFQALNNKLVSWSSKPLSAVWLNRKSNKTSLSNTPHIRDFERIKRILSLIKIWVF